VILAKDDDTIENKAYHAETYLKLLFSEAKIKPRQPLEQPDFGTTGTLLKGSTTENPMGDWVENDGEYTREFYDEMLTSSSEASSDKEADKEGVEGVEIITKEGEEAPNGEKGLKVVKSDIVTLDPQLRIFLPLSSDLTLEEYCTLATQVAARIREVQANNQTKVEQSLSADELRDTCRLIFERIFSVVGVHRTRLLIGEYRESL